ncbi:MAG: hypothetical protein GDA36_01890 [Rhodobacteraceae bacterium]|nr:hypothetical protein [Paracoccaceae bacterium]
MVARNDASGTEYNIRIDGDMLEVWAVEVTINGDAPMKTEKTELSLAHYFFR